MEELNNEYFIRHTDVLEIYDNDFNMLFEERLFGVHYGSSMSRDKLLDEGEYGKDGKRAISLLKELASTGGYVWSDYSSIGKSQIGYVKPNSQIIIEEFEVNASKFRNRNIHEIFPENKLFLKCLKLDTFKEIKKNELLMLRARRPQQGTFVHWKKSYGIIKKALENELPLPIKSWEHLTPDLQEIVSYEYLREIGVNNWKLKFLLMPIGRTMEGIDIYALNDKNEKIFVQVTNKGNDKKKIKKLKEYDGNKVYISSRDNRSSIHDGIQLLHTSIIFDWLKLKEEFLKSLMN